MDYTTKIKVLLAKKGMNASQLAKKSGIVQSNLSKKMSHNKFSIEDLEKIAAALDATFEGHFVLNDGEKI